MTIWHNTKLKDDLTPVLSFDDRLRIGDAVFDTMLSINGEPVHTSMHFDRLAHDASVLGIEMPYDLKEMIRAARSVLQEGGLTQGRACVNTIVSRGPAERGLMPPDLSDTQIIMRAVKAPTHFPPIHAIIARFVRRNEGSPLSQIKSVNYGDNVLALKEAKDCGANEALMLNNKGHITCATSANVFVVYNGRFYTPPLKDGVLAGITRQILMDKLDVIEKSLTEEDLLQADGVFLTSSIKGFVPLVSLEGKELRHYETSIPQDFHII